jgi:hypothetical protein
MMNRNETTTLLTIVGIAILGVAVTMSSPTRVIGQSDQDFTPDTEFTKVSMDATGPAFNINGEEKDNNDDSTIATTDDDEKIGADDVTKSDDQDSTQQDYKELQVCLSGLEGQGSPTEDGVRDCMQAGYGRMDSEDNASTESTDDSDDDNNDMRKAIDDTEDGQDEE